MAINPLTSARPSDAVMPLERLDVNATPFLEEQFPLDANRGNERAQLLSRILACSDVAAAAMGGWIGAMAGGMDTTSSTVFVVGAALSWFLVVFTVGLYHLDTLRDWASGMQQLGRIFGAALLISWPWAALATLLGADAPIVAALTGTSTALGLSLAGRTVARGVLHRVTPLRQRTVILGSGIVAAHLEERLRRHSELGLEPLGIIDDEVHHAVDHGLPVLGRISDLRQVLRTYSVDRVIIAFSRASHEQLLASMRACREERVAVDVVPRLFEFLEGARAVERIGSLPVLSIGAHKLSRSASAAKRVVDIAISGALLILLLPLLIVLAAAVKLESRGPIFFRQARAGRGGHTFDVIKFRSMYPNADEMKTTVVEQNEMTDGVLFKIRADPRVTRVGRILRRLSLDELPQLLNVLRGEMSLVGPRPLILPESEALAENWHARRLDLRPGLTGPWQVSGRSDLSVHDMVRLDFQYVTGWSLARDVEILLATIPVVLTGRGAY
jgi:exopolysaccharide biosynthesis polyprenyl glycosylphosphotransferase